MVEAQEDPNHTTFVATMCETSPTQQADLASPSVDPSDVPVILVQAPNSATQQQPDQQEGKLVTRAVITTALVGAVSVSRLHLCEFHLQDSCPKVQEYQMYQASHPLVYNMLAGEERRRQQLEKEGAVQMKNQPTNDAGWFRTLFVWEGRALGFILTPWILVVGHAILYTCLNKLVLDEHQVWTDDVTSEFTSWETLFGIALNATLSLLLVFRLNRAAARWWLARQYFGIIIANTRTLVSGLVIHGPHDPVARDHAIRWTAAYPLCVMEFLRGCDELHDNLFAGILNASEKKILEQQSHPPLYAAHQIHYFLVKLLTPKTDTPQAVATAQGHQLATLEQQWNVLLDQCGAMERIKATPLPIVYVSHLRTFLLMALLLYPYVWGSEWKWSTIPIVALAAFGMLGIEAAAVEVEQPFHKDRVNALNMDGFWYVITSCPFWVKKFVLHCQQLSDNFSRLANSIGILANILQTIRQEADRELAELTKRV